MGRLVAYKPIAAGVEQVEIGVVIQRTDSLDYVVLKPDRRVSAPFNASTHQIVLIPEKYVPQEGPRSLIRTRGQGENYGVLTRVEKVGNVERLVREKKVISLVGQEVQIEVPGFPIMDGIITHEDLNAVTLQFKDKSSKTINYPEKNVGEMKVTPFVSSFVAQKDHSYLFRNASKIADDELKIAEANGVAGYIGEKGKIFQRTNLNVVGKIKYHVLGGFNLYDSTGNYKVRGNFLQWSRPSQFEEGKSLGVYQPYGSDVHSFFAVNP